MSIQQENNSVKNQRLITKLLLLVNAIVLSVFAWFGGVKDVNDYWNDSQRAELNLVLTPDKRVRSGQIINLNYSAPTSGYLSLWNLNSQGQIKNIVPVHTLGPHSHPQKLAVAANTEQGMEQIIMLWTPRSSHHPKKPIYMNDAEFSGVVKMLPDVEKKVAQVYVYASVSVNTF